MDRASERLVLQRGTEIICHHCRLYLGRLRRDINLLTRLKGEMFEGPNIHAFGPTRCPRCSATWYLPNLGRIHTRAGWFPSDDEMGDLKDGLYDIQS